MSLGRSYLLALGLIAVAGLAITGLSWWQDQFYRGLVQRGKEVIENASGRPPILFARSDVAFGAIPPGYALVSVRTTDGAVLQTRYYVDRVLVVTDEIGEGGQVIRRDLFDARGAPRVRILFDGNGNEVGTQYLDEDQNVRSRSRPILPYVGNARMY
jgi:hypothetical protein